MKKMHLKKEPNLELKLKAFPYQEDAFNAIKNLTYAAIFHEQGLGKTKIAIDLIMYWIAETDIDTVIILTKKQLVRNWQLEFETHSYIKPAILSDDKHNNYYVFNGPARVIIAHFETINSEFERYSLFLRSRNVAIIIDESAKIKNPDTLLDKNLFELSPDFKRKVIMTGTPIANRPYDIWAQVYFLDGGKSLGLDYNAFKKHTNLSNDLSEDHEKQQMFEDSVADIYEKIKPFTVRETKNSGIIVLPNKEYINERVDFEPNQFNLYEKVRKELCLEIRKGNEVFLDESSAIVKRLLRLVQITSNPKLLDDSYLGMSAKEKCLNDIIKSITVKQEKCIVWSVFTDNIDYFCKMYKKYGAVKIHGGMNMEERNRSVERFKKYDDCKVLFATPSSAKEGLTLTIANHVIFYDRGFSLDDYLQAQDRIHRISQTKTCYIHNLIVNDSIDEWIDILLKAKQSAASLGQGDIGREQYIKKMDYSFGEIVHRILNPDEEEY